MNYQDILGMAEIVESLQGAMRENRVVHAYLFTGPAGTGKRTLAEICARALFCQGDAKPCDECPACKRYLGDSHPDIVRMETAKSIGVEDIRNLLAKLAVKPYEGGRHVVIVQDADKMTVQAQNALLKTLETPPEDTVFFLLTARIKSLLPTIISRCQMVRFHLIAEDQVLSALNRQGVDGERAKLASRLSEGSVGQALEMARSETYWALRERVIRALTALNAPEDVAVAARELKGDKENATAILEVMEQWARDLMVVQDADGEIFESDRLGSFSEKKIVGAQMLQSVMDARRMLTSNVSWQSVLEMLFFDIVGGNL